MPESAHSSIGIRQRRRRRKVAFLALSLLSIGCFFDSLGNPFEHVETPWRVENSSTGQIDWQHSRRVVETNSEQDETHEDYHQPSIAYLRWVYGVVRVQKMTLLSLSLFAAGLAMLLGKSIEAATALEEAETELDATLRMGKVQRQIERARHSQAMQLEALRQIHGEELSELKGLRDETELEAASNEESHSRRTSGRSAACRTPEAEAAEARRPESPS